MFKGKVFNKDKVINICEFLYGDICQPKVKVIQDKRHRASHYSQVGTAETCKGASGVAGCMEGKTKKATEIVSRDKK